MAVHDRISQARLLEGSPRPFRLALLPGRLFPQVARNGEAVMAHRNEIDAFLTTWEQEAQNTIRLLEALPGDQYDFRPDPKGRSIGELAWHLSEIDGCLSFGVAERRFRLDDDL